MSSLMYPEADPEQSKDILCTDSIVHMLIFYWLQGEFLYPILSNVFQIMSKQLFGFTTYIS